jgi:hypothetical protein
MGAVGIGALIAHVAFWALLVRGWSTGDLRTRTVAVFLGLWIFGFVVVSRFPYIPFASLVAVLDIVLVLIVFKGDVHLR